MSRRVVITGANRGIGLAMVASMAKRGHYVVATARNPEKATELQQLKDEYTGKIEIQTLDVGSDVSVQGFGAMLEKQGPIDVLINNAGVMGEGGVPFAECSLESIMDTVNVNAIGGMRVTRALLPVITGADKPVVAHITSKMGSIEDNTGGGYYGYRMSKAALNMFNKSFAQDFQQITSVVIHPGWVKTDMGGGNAPTTTEQSAEGICEVVLNAKLSQSGSFFDFEGKSIPW